MRRLVGKLVEYREGRARATLVRFAVTALVPLAVSCSGGEEDDPKNPWSDRTYLLEVPGTHWSEPPQIGNEIGDFVPKFMLRIQGSAPDSFQVLVGTADANGAQNTCNPTALFQATSSGSPNVQIGPGAFPVHLQHPTQDVAVDATIHELTLTNILPDGAALAEEGELTAMVDARELYPLFTLLPEPSPDAVCAALDSFNAACAPCPHDSEAYCLALKAVRLGASELAGAGMQPVDAANRDPSCP